MTITPAGSRTTYAKYEGGAGPMYHFSLDLLLRPEEPNQCRCISGFIQIMHEVDGTLNGLRGEGPHCAGCTVTELGV